MHVAPHVKMLVVEIQSLTLEKNVMMVGLQMVMGVMEVVRKNMGGFAMVRVKAVVLLPVGMAKSVAKLQMMSVIICEMTAPGSYLPAGRVRGGRGHPQDGGESPSG